ncbi:hypothetical protein ABW19_dt0200287 [Dactylella cylindrospora]|nr:hypothetical protein ABW19_dt0200287 [Dactylella cylindrospora]
MNCIFLTTTNCTSWQWSLTGSSTSSLRGSYPRSAKHVKKIHSQPELHTPNLVPSEPVPFKRPRTGLERTAPHSAGEAQVEAQFDLPPGFVLPEIRVTPQPSASDRVSGSDCDASRPKCFIDVDLNTNQSWLDSTPYHRGDADAAGLAISPLEAPLEFLDDFGPQQGDPLEDPLGDIEMVNADDEEAVNIDATEASGPETCYTLERFLADKTGSTPSQSPSPPHSCPNLIPSEQAAPIDIKIKTELQRFELDISSALEDMNLASDDEEEEWVVDDEEEAEEVHTISSNLETKRDSDNGSNAGCGTENQDFGEDESDYIFTLDEDETVVVHPRGISPQLEAWISESSVIVGRSMKPFVGSVDTAGFPKGRKRKASTCQ